MCLTEKRNQPLPFQRKAQPRRLVYSAWITLVVASILWADDSQIPRSNLEGKKLIRISQSLLGHVEPENVATKLDEWQETGYDGLCFCWRADLKEGEQRKPMNWGWWDVDLRKRSEFDADVRTYRSIANWGKFTDNFMLMASHAEGHKPPDWFNDDDWKIVLANTKLCARITREIGFKGIVFDIEGYGGGAYGVWRQPWDYSLYARSDYQIEKRDKPREFQAVAAKIRQRGRQWAQAISGEFPDIVLMVLPGLYAASWPRVTEARFGGDLAGSDSGLWPAFIDGMLEGLDERALLVSGSEATYITSQYRDMLVMRNYEKEQALLVSAVPELARRRVSFAAGIWTDAGYNAPRFSVTDPRHNHREPRRHMHAVHNALAVSDHYAWQWGEWGVSGESNWMTTEPTPLIRQYWQANIDARNSLSLEWRPEPHHDPADYAETNSKVAESELALWKRLEAEGYRARSQLPIHWRFDFDPEMLVRYRNYFSTDFDDRSWRKIDCRRCWQMQGYLANEIGSYRAWFEAPADLDPERQEIFLVFGGLGSGRGHVYLNGGWVAYAQQKVDVSQSIKPGERNLIGLLFQNRSGPGGLMGRVKLLVRDKE